MAGARVLTGLFTLPLVTPFIILGIALLIAFNSWGLGLSLVSVAIGHIIICVPFAMFVLMSRLESFDQSIEEVIVPRILSLGIGWIRIHHARSNWRASQVPKQL